MESHFSVTDTMAAAHVHGTCPEPGNVQVVCKDAVSASDVLDNDAATL